MPESGFHPCRFYKHFKGKCRLVEWKKETKNGSEAGSSRTAWVLTRPRAGYLTLQGGFPSAWKTRTIPPPYRATALSHSGQVLWCWHRKRVSVKGDSPYHHVTVPLGLPLSMYSEDEQLTALMSHFCTVTSFHSKTFLRH